MALRAVRATRARLVALALLALLAGLVAGRASAQSRVAVLLPDCHPAHLDTVTLPELLHIELEDVEGDAIEVALSSALCDPTARSVEVVIRDRGRDRSAREVIEISDEADPSSRARAIALAVAERARLILGRRPPEPVADVTPADPEPPVETGMAAPAAEPIASVPSRARETLAPPQAPTASASAGESAPRAPSDALGPVLTSPVAFRVAPVLPSWALGTRPMLRAQLDASFSLEGGLLLLGSHAEPFDGRVDVLVAALAGRAGYALLRTSSLDLTVLAGAELGVLAAFGSPTDSPGRSSAHPWLTAGAALELGVPLTPDVALTADVGASALIFGTRVQSTAGPQIELAFLTIDAAIGVRARLPR